MLQHIMRETQTLNKQMANDHGTRLAFLAEKWSGENRTNQTGGAATVCALVVIQQLQHLVNLFVVRVNVRKGCKKKQRT